MSWAGFDTSGLIDDGVISIEWSHPTFAGGGQRSPCLAAITITKVFRDGRMQSAYVRFDGSTMMWPSFVASLLRLNSELSVVDSEQASGLSGK